MKQNSLIKTIVFLLTIAMMFTFTACGEDDDNNSSEEQTTESTTITTELTVWGMTCGRCENKIKNALLEIDGVINVTADSNADKVTVEHEPDLDVTIIEKAITGEGFNLP